MNTNNPTDNANNPFTFSTLPPSVPPGTLTYVEPSSQRFATIKRELTAIAPPDARYVTFQLRDKTVVLRLTETRARRDRRARRATTNSGTTPRKEDK